jgi:hypothetical protein
MGEALMREPMERGARGLQGAEDGMDAAFICSEIVERVRESVESQLLTRVGKLIPSSYTFSLS